MDPIAATLVSKSKSGKRAMVIVHGEADGKSYSATRHVERQGRNNPFIGANPDPRTITARNQAAERVRFANERLRYCKDALANLQDPNDPNTKHVTPKQINAAEANVKEAEVILKVAEDNLAQTQQDFPLQVEFDF